jgi:hypothetical protein
MESSEKIGCRNNPACGYWFPEPRDSPRDEIHSLLSPCQKLRTARRYDGLDASGKSPAYVHRRNNKPAPRNRPRAFFASNDDRPSRRSKKILPRRANHRHIDIIATIEPAPGNWSRAFCIGRRPHFKTPHPPMQRIDARRVLIELPSEPLKLSMISAQTRGAVLRENHLRIMFD